MRVVGRERLAKAEEEYSGSGLGKALDAWLRVVEGATWRHFMHVRAAWSGVDNVPPYVVFDIKGNQFRLTAIINYQMQTLLVSKIQSHREYTRKGI